MLYQSVIFYFIILLSGVLNFILFNLRIDSAAFPDIEIVVVFCAAFYYGASLFSIFTYGLIIDLFHCTHFGITSLVFIITFLVFTAIQKNFKLLDYCNSYIVCLMYLMLFTSLKLFLIAIYDHININYQILIFKILTSSLCYFPLSKIFQYIFRNLTLSDVE